MADVFKRESVELDSPGRSWVQITPNDSVDIAQRPRSIYLPVGGSVSCVGDNGQIVVFTLAAGWHPISPLRIRATGTTGGLVIVGVW